jgi:glutathione S-transferase
VRLPYVAHPVNIGAGDQFAPAFLTISPNNKIPAITDPNGPDGKPISLFESGAILVYLAGKTGKLMPPATAPLRGAAVVDVPDGQRRADARAGAPLPPVCTRKAPLRDRPLQQRGQAHLWRDRQATVDQQVHRWQDVFDRRHRHLPVAAQLENQGITIDDFRT